MSILKVARMGHPVLRAKARPLEKAEIRTAAMQKLIDDMIDTMSEYHGIGLAAPQIHEGLRIFVAALDAGDDDEEPSDIRGRVPRAREIKVRAFDRTGARIELSAHDFPARVIQHETDHLDGVLFFDRMKSLASMTFLDEYSRYWRKDAD